MIMRMILNIGPIAWHKRIKPIFFKKQTKIFILMAIVLLANSILFNFLNTCFAQTLHENTDNSLPQKELLNFNGLIQVDITNHDSQNKNEPSFSAVHARAGGNGQKGIVTAKLGVEFAGNQPYTQKVKQEPTPAVETFEVALNVEYSVSPSQIFVDTHAQAKQYEAKSYFTFMYIF